MKRLVRICSDLFERPALQDTDHGYGRRSYLHRHMDLGPYDSRVTVRRASDVERFVERLTT